APTLPLSHSPTLGGTYSNHVYTLIGKSRTLRPALGGGRFREVGAVFARCYFLRLAFILLAGDETTKEWRLNKVPIWIGEFVGWSVRHASVRTH
ncbi:MAG: hypothetical protein ACPGWR_33600, partial [Ardenticatenaceae bacterium]